MSNTMNLAVVVGMHALTRPHAPALIEDRRIIGYGALAAAIRSAAAALAAQGVGPGDRVGVSMQQSSEHLIVVLALARMGAISVPLHPTRRDEFRLAVCKRYGVGLVVTDRPPLLLEGLAGLVVDADTFRRDVSPSAVPARGGGSTVWRLDLTSGTTAVPKAIAATHERSLMSAWIAEALPAMRAPERFACFMDFNINSGITPAIRQLVMGRTVVIVREQRAEAFFEAVERHGATATQTAPAFLDLLIRASSSESPRCPGLEAVFAVGGVMTPAQQARFIGRVTPNLYARYGSTETGAISLAGPADLARHPESVGRFVPWIHGEIVDDEGRPLPPGHEGLLRLRGMGLADGYFDDPEASARVFRDGWICLGDVGSIARDGRLTLGGRADEMVNLRGTKVAFEPIEAAIAEQPGVLDAAAFAITARDGEVRLCAAVVGEPGLDERALVEALRPRLKMRTPRRLMMLETIPRNPSGKVVRGELVRRYEAIRAAERERAALAGGAAAEFDDE